MTPHLFNKDFDWILFFTWILLMAFGVIAIYSASTIRYDYEVTHSDFYIKQYFYVIFALIIFFIILRVPTTIQDIFIYPSYYLVLALLVLVLFTPAVNNSHRWIPLLGVNIQPSELAKLVIILLSAKILARDHITSFQMLMRPAIYALIYIALILRQPDLGTSLVFIIAMFVMLAQANFPPIYLLLITTPIISILTSFYPIAFVVFAALLIFLLIKKRFALHFIIFIMIINLVFLFITPVLWNSLKPYQQKRILTFIDPTQDPLNAGYQVIQAKIAVGSGQLYGKGFLQGTQKNMNFLPEHHTDFIFSVVSEEFGFVGSVTLVLLFLILFFRIIKCIFRSEVKEHRIAMAGILGYMVFQVLINMGMNIGLMPTTGIPLPFISYGGSSLIVNSMAIALVLKYARDKDV